MPRIYRISTNYSPPHDGLNTITEQSHPCNRLDLCRCLATVGSPRLISLERIRTYGLARTLYDSIFKNAALVFTYVRAEKNGDLCRHAIFDSQVTDEKRIVSYNLGMALAKFYSQELLDIPHLIHVETLKKQNAIAFIPHNNRPREPDLVGQTSGGQWHVFEAKGVSRSSGQLPSKLAEAKIQVRQVSAIRNSSPSTRSACASYIGADRILTHLEDPPSDAETSIEVNTGSFLNAYYAPYLMADGIEGVTRRTLVIGGRSFKTIKLEREDGTLTIGVETTILDSILSSVPDFPGQISISSRDSQANAGTSYSIGPDGFLFGYKTSLVRRTA